MGTWGTRIFSDDVAADVKHSYRLLVGHGATSAEATDFLIGKFEPLVRDDPDTRCPFWLGLAVTQWKCGRLEDRVKATALEIIDGGVDEARWTSDAKLARARRKVLAETRTLIASPQPPEKRIPKKFIATCDWEIGELIHYRLLSGRSVVLRVADLHKDGGGTYPCVQFYDWVGDTIEIKQILASRMVSEPADELMSKIWSSATGQPLDETRTFIISQGSERELPKDRLFRLNYRTDGPGLGGSLPGVRWRNLDEFLDQRFGWK